MKLNILGTEYKVIYICGGYCCGNTKTIAVSKFDRCLDGDEAVRTMQKTALRHEIVHAFLNESGLCENTHSPLEGWAKCEEIVDWIAIQSPKMLKVFEKAGCL